MLEKKISFIKELDNRFEKIKSLNLGNSELKLLKWLQNQKKDKIDFKNDSPIAQPTLYKIIRNWGFNGVSEFKIFWINYYEKGN